MVNQFMQRARAWMLLVPTLGALGCAGDNATSNGPVVATVMIAQADYIVGLRATRQIELFAYDDRNNPIPLPAGIVWNSSDPSRVTVDAAGTARGVILGGPVTITASMASGMASTRVIVRPASVTISPALDSVVFGQSVQLTATARDADGTAVEAGATTWSVAPTSAATISPTGLVTAGTGGAFTVTATIDAVTGRLSTGVTSPFDGSWVGAGLNGYGQPQTIRFNVRFGLIALFLIPDVRTSCGFQVTTQFADTLSVPIVDGSFTYRVLEPFGGGATAYTIAGTFLSPTTMTGSYVNVHLPPVQCAGGGLGSPSYVTSTYNAAKQ